MTEDLRLWSALRRPLRHLRIVRRRFDLGGEMLQLSALAPLVQDFDRFQPLHLGRSVQLAQVTQSSLARTIGFTHRFYQRPVSMVLSVLPALMLQQTSGGDIVTNRSDNKRAGLHYIAFGNRARLVTNLD
jgi:hypothetical protein